MANEFDARVKELPYPDQLIIKQLRSDIDKLAEAMVLTAEELARVTTHMMTADRLICQRLAKLEGLLNAD